MHNMKWVYCVCVCVCALFLSSQGLLNGHFARCGTSLKAGFNKQSA